MNEEKLARLSLQFGDFGAPPLMLDPHKHCPCVVTRVKRMASFTDHLTTMARRGWEVAYVNVYDGAYGGITHESADEANLYGKLNPRLQFRVKVTLK